MSTDSKVSWAVRAQGGVDSENSVDLLFSWGQRGQSLDGALHPVE